MTEKIKLYLASIEAIHVKQLPQGGHYITARHYPLMLDAPSIDIAIAGACENAERIFPKHQGWQIRNTTIRPIPPELIDRFLSMAESLRGNTDPVESAKIAMCDVYTPKPQDPIIWEFDKPAA